jgi:deferrochelatase/peroxidase EfeB
MSTRAVPFDGPHQAGIETAPPTQMILVGFDTMTDRMSDLANLMQRWTQAARNMAMGLAADELDSGEAVDLGPSQLTLTFGFGPSLFSVSGFDLAGKLPAGFGPLPAFPGEQIDPAMSFGDIVIQACADDRQVAGHAIRQLARIGTGTVRMRWQQVGFRGDPTEGSTFRNLLGFKDGTINPQPGSPAFDSTVWTSGGGWMAGGTYMVVRRILVDIDKWDGLTGADQQIVIGRAKLSGAPLSGGSENSPLDLAALGPDGVPAIPLDSHVRLADPDSNDGATMLRRGYNYDDGIDPTTGRANAGTIFVAFVADIESQFVPIQSRLASSDRLNSFITPVATATFAVPPGVTGSDFVGHGLFD